MASYQDVQNYMDQFSPISKTFTDFAVQKNPHYGTALGEYTRAMQRVQDLLSVAGSTGSVPDDQFNSAKGFVQSVLSKNSDVLRGLLPDQSSNQALTDLSGVQPGQYVDPRGAGGVTGSPVSPQPTAVDQQAVSDQAKIEQEGQRQYQQQQDFITSDASRRESSRQQLAQLLTKQAQESFAKTLPATAEDYNAGHLLNSSGYGNEVARQQAQLAQGIANQIGQTGLQDVNLQTQQGQTALGGLQGYQTSGLNRNFSLQDFQRQAQLSKELGMMAAPQVGNGKGAAGSIMSGVGALAPYAFLATGNPGMAAATAGVNSRTQASGGGK